MEDFSQQKIQIKCQALFFPDEKKKKIKVVFCFNFELHFNS